MSETKELTAEEMLRKFNITPATSYHSHKYIYPSIIEAMKQYAEQERRKAFEASRIIEYDAAGTTEIGYLYDFSDYTNENNLK